MPKPNRRKGQKAAPAPKPMGRPPEPVPHDIAEALLDWIYDGGTFVAFCRKPGMPKYRTVCDWADKDPDFAARLQRAKKARGPLLQEIAQEIADDGSEDWHDVEGKDGKVRRVFDHEHVQRSKLRVDQLNRRAACDDPIACGTSTKVALGGDASAPPIQVANTGPEVPAIADLAAGIAKLAELSRELLTPGDG